MLSWKTGQPNEVFLQTFRAYLYLLLDTGLVNRFSLKQGEGRDGRDGDSETGFEWEADSNQ